MTRSTRPGAAALALAAFVLPLLVGPRAGATSYVCPADVGDAGVGGDYDTCGDVSRLGGDIVVFHADRGIRGRHELTTSVATTAMPDPARGLAWEGTETRIEIYWDTDRALPGREYRTVITAPDHVLTATTTTRDGEVTCTTTTAVDLGEGRVGYVRANAGVAATLPYSCLPGLRGSDVDASATARFRVELHYQRRPGTPIELDRAPNVGWRVLPPVRPRTAS